jgi:hypothetical protein
MFQSIIDNIKNNIEDEHLNLKNYYDFEGFEKNNLESFNDIEDKSLINKILDKFECLFNNLDLFLNYKKEFKNNSIYWTIIYFMYVHRFDNIPNISGLNICEYIFLKKKEMFDNYLFDNLVSNMYYDGLLYLTYFDEYNAWTSNKYNKYILSIIELKYKNYKLEKENKKLKNENLKLKMLSEVDELSKKFNEI